MNSKGNNRSFISRILVFIFAMLSLAGLASMIIGVMAPHISPAKFVWASFFGLAFWPLLIVNVILFFVLLLLHSKSALIPILSLLIAIPGFLKSYSFGKDNSANGNLRVMSYNIRTFMNMDDEIKPVAFADSIVEMIKRQNPDVICLQEFFSYSYNLNRADCIKDFAEKIGFEHVYFNRNRNYGGNVIFSKYPIKEMPKDSYFGAENISGVMVQVDAGDKGSFYLTNLHLLSYQISNDEIDYLVESEKKSVETEKYGKSIFFKLKKAYANRGDDTKEILKNIPEINKPIIICGDFNDTPLSYTYQSMKNAGLKDCFIVSGKGIGTTYAGKLPLLRIDYIWCSKQIAPSLTKRLKFKGSDHYPLIMDFQIID